jgi:Helix-turn-helix domain
MADLAARTCAFCTRELASQHGSGRARVYCSATCRSAARRRRDELNRKSGFSPATGNGDGRPVNTAPDIRRRWVEDVPTARALAHPLRWRLLGILRTAGPATAAQLAARVGQSAANCSWHLRLLHRYGFVAPQVTTSRRDRPWRAEEVALVFAGAEGGLPADEREALLTVFHEHEIAVFRSWWRTAREREPQPWREAAFSQLSVVWITADELDRLGTAIGDTIVAFTGDRSRPAARPRGARQARVFAWAVPM